MKSVLLGGELYDIGAGNRKKLQEAFKTNDPKVITEAFSDYFEKPGVPHKEKRTKSASKWYEQLKPKEYTIKPGDTLSEIAQEHNTTVEKLQEKNKIEDPDKINIDEVK